MTSSTPIIHWQSINPTEKPDRSDIAEQEAAGLPPLFTPAMRSVIEPPKGKVEVAGPPNRPGIPTSSIITVLLPLVGLLILGVVTLVFMRGGNSMFMLMSAPLMLVSVAGGLIGFFRERKKYRIQLSERERIYNAHLADCSRQLEALRQQQIKASLTPHPDLQGCLERSRLADPERRLWERSPLDPDFLRLRIGVGTQPAAYEINFGLSANDKMDQDALVRRAREMVKEYEQVENLAISLPLFDLGVLGITGSRAEIQQAGRTLLMQLTTHHLPNEVKLVLIFPEDERDQWSWARWLPHLWSEDGAQRMVASSPREASALLLQLSHLFSQRQLALHKNEKSEGKRFEPHYFFFFADPQVIDEANESTYNKLFAILMTEGSNLGASTVLCQGARQKLDRACKAVVNFKPSPNIYFGIPKPETVNFTPDDIHSDVAEQFSRSLAPLRLKTRSRNQEKGSRLSEFVSLYDLLRISKPEDLPLESNWSRRAPLVPLSAPIGLQVEGPTYINLQEGAVQGLGPHAVVGGMTGTGKTKGLLHTLILSLAAHHHPYDLNFLLIDYKGGDLYEDLKELPHVVGYLGNLSSSRKQSALVRRLFICLEAELKRRRNLLGSASINSFHEEQRLQLKNPNIVLPHLVVVIDEFAELISKNPPDVTEFLRSNLVSIARTGRSLGVHLILATQDPGNVVRGDIRDAVNLILCLGMGTRDASHELLETEDAYIENLGKHMGRAYFKAKRENQYTQFQVAFSGAPVEVTTAESIPPEKKIHETTLSGQPGRCIYPEPSYRKTTSPSPTVPLIQTECEVLTRWLADYAEAQEIQKLPNPFMPLLPEKVALEDLREDGTGWLTGDWQPSQQMMNPLIGLLDDPANLQQAPMRLNLAEGGHLAVYSNDGSETGSFLTSLVISLSLDTPPDRLHIYILDFEGQRLNALRTLPHLGDLISLDEPERAMRLLVFLRRKLKERKERLAREGWATFRELQEKSAEPVSDIVLILNNYTQFEASVPYCVELLVQLIDQGAASYGIHLVVTGNRSSAISRRISNLVRLAVALKLSPDDDVSLVVGTPLPSLLPTGVTGRGLVRGVQPLEFQTALVNAQEIIAQMRQAWKGACPPPAPVLRETVSLSELFEDEEDQNDPTRNARLRVPLGINTDSLETLWVDLQSAPLLLITGRAQGGKTSLIQTCLVALASRIGSERLKFHFINPGVKNQRLFLLRNLPHTSAYADTDQDIEALIQSLFAEITARRTAFESEVKSASDIIDEAGFTSRYPALFLILDDYEQIFKTLQKNLPAASILESLIRQGNRFGLCVIMGVAYKEIQGPLARDPVLMAMRESQTGALFDRSDQLPVFAYQTPKILPVPLPPGRGYLVHKGLYQPFQACLATADGSTLSEWIEKINT